MANRRVSLRSSGGQWLSARDSMAGTSGVCGFSETIDLVPIDVNQVALRSCSASYLRAAPDGLASWSNGVDDDLWTLERLPGGRVALRSAHGLYLSTHADGSVRADAAQAAESESFAIYNWTCVAEQWDGAASASGTGDASERWASPAEGPVVRHHDVSVEPKAALHRRVALHGAHGNYVCAEPDGRAVCDRKALGPWEKFDLVDLGNDAVALRGHHGMYLCAEPDGRAVCDRHRRAEWETWTLCRLPNGQAALRSWRGLYLSAQPDGRLEANRSALGPWETFGFLDVVPRLGGASGDSAPLLSAQPTANRTVALHGAHGRYVCAEPDGRAVCDRSELGPWETFVVEALPGDRVALRAHHGTYLCGEPSGRLTCDRRTRAEWETWTLCRLAGGKAALRSWHGLYLSAQPDNRLEANQLELGPWETFTLEG
eukprot:TRINITY_DN1251_c0_g2_i3.p1 TRINITY_DN1251_c0_g2~~TRINITY_DN1251_c0_g2_i3.p1  ORF type:complete len:430 (-),score=72.68 TRINITY_DN1251_c0_g2_i3:179-1468(-)